VCFTPDFLGFKIFKEHKFYLCVLLTFEMLKQLSKGLNLKFKLENFNGVIWKEKNGTFKEEIQFW
jgi:hypothetical protein